MKKILSKLCLLVIFSYLFMFTIGLCFGNQFSYSYNASIIDKVSRLKQINEPKIILIGNSNVAFGFDSEMIEKETGMYVVNMGLDAGLGNAVSENMCKFNINDGDIVVLCHTDYSNDGVLDYVTAAWNTIEYNFDLYRIINLNDIYGMIKSYPKYFAMCISNVLFKNNSDIGISYKRDSFNKYGDISIRENKNVSLEKYNTYSFSIPTLDDMNINRINKLNEYVNSLGASLVIAGYPIMDGPNNFDKNDIMCFEKELKDNLKCDVISNFNDYYIDYDKFYDTTYHLTKEGAEIRTRLFIEDINKWLLNKHNK